MNKCKIDFFFLLKYQLTVITGFVLRALQVGKQTNKPKGLNIFYRAESLSVNFFKLFSHCHMQLSGLVVTNSISSTFQPALMETDLTFSMAPITELQTTGESRGVFSKENSFTPKKTCLGSGGTVVFQAENE